MSNTKTDSMDLEVEERSNKRKEVDNLQEPDGEEKETKERPTKRVRLNETEDTVVDGLSELKLEFINVEVEVNADADEVKPSVTFETDDEDNEEDNEDEEEYDDDVVTYFVTDGKLKGYEVSVVSETEGKVQVSIVKNARGKPLSRALMKEVPKDWLRPLDSYDMLTFAEDVDAEEEDPALKEHEQKTWECPKCRAKVKNEHGFCPKILADGKPCLAAPSGKIIGWGNCFAAAPKMWQCSCTTPNNVEVDKCAACGEPRSNN